MQEVIKLSSMKYNGIYRGIVVDTTDPLKYGRVKIKVLPMMNDIQIAFGELKDALPWAVPAMPISEGAATGYGSFTVPQVDAMVWCFFENGDFMQPVYFAEATDGVHGLPSWRTTNYPNRKGVTLKNGIKLYVDESNGLVYFEHPSGATVQIDSAGNISVEAKNNVTIKAPNSINMDVPLVSATQNLEVGNGADGAFTAESGEIVTVVKGIVISIV